LPWTKPTAGSLAGQHPRRKGRKAFWAIRLMRGCMKKLSANPIPARPKTAQPFFETASVSSASADAALVAGIHVLHCLSPPANYATVSKTKGKACRVAGKPRDVAHGS